jgi:hypothetical protein
VTFITLAAAGAASLSVYVLALRPWQLRWGASDDECRQPMPGDDLVPSARVASTRAITIRAPAANVWPWLVQMGYQRGGWYAYDWLEALAGAHDFVDGHSATRIIPELQHLEVGEVIRMGPSGGLAVVALEPQRLLVLRARIDAATGHHLDAEEPLPDTLHGLPASFYNVSWAFALNPLDDTTTRLVTRFRVGYQPTVPNNLFGRLLLEPGTFLLERKMLLGMRERAEALNRS